MGLVASPFTCLTTCLQESPPQTGTGVIAGTVFADSNDNNVQDAHEAGLTGVTVRAFVDSNGNGVRDGSEVQHQTVSDDQGRYNSPGLMGSSSITFRKTSPSAGATRRKNWQPKW